MQRRRLEKLTKGVTSGTTFGAVAREFHGVKKSGWSQRYADRWIERMEKTFSPGSGPCPYRRSAHPFCFTRSAASRNAGRTKPPIRCGRQPGESSATQLQPDDAIEPAPDLHGALQPIIVKHMSAVLEPAAAASLLRAIWAYEGQPLTRAALKLSALSSSAPETSGTLSGRRSTSTPNGGRSPRRR